MTWLHYYCIIAVIVAVVWVVYCNWMQGAGLYATPVQAILVGALWWLAIPSWIADSLSRKIKGPKITTSEQQKTYEGPEP